MNLAMIALIVRALGPGPDASTIAHDIDYVIEQRAAQGLPPVTSSPQEDAALVARFVAHESGASIHPIGWSWDARAHVSCGPLQLRCDRIAGRSVRWQVAAWLSDVATGGLEGVCGSGQAAVRIAAHRRREALRVLRSSILPVETPTTQIGPTAQTAAP